MVGVGEQQLPDLLARGEAVPAHDIVRAEVVEQPRHPRRAPRLARALRVAVHVRVLEQHVLLALGVRRAEEG
eukprot:scaffold145510_cov232-Phaeocystis_antarctica.AAC.1